MIAVAHYPNTQDHTVIEPSEQSQQINDTKKDLQGRDQAQSLIHSGDTNNISACENRTTIFKRCARKYSSSRHGRIFVICPPSNHRIDLSAVAGFPYAKLLFFEPRPKQFYLLNEALQDSAHISQLAGLDYHAEAIMSSPEEYLNSQTCDVMILGREVIYQPHFVRLIKPRGLLLADRFNNSLTSHTHRKHIARRALPGQLKLIEEIHANEAAIRIFRRT